jgi:hypothetical protein
MKLDDFVTVQPLPVLSEKVHRRSEHPKKSKAPAAPMLAGAGIAQSEVSAEHFLQLIDETFRHRMVDILAGCLGELFK